MSGPRALAIEPPPEILAAAAPRRLSIRFDRAMDTSRGRVRLVWGRISAHFVNRERRMWRWDLRDQALTWTPDARAIELALEPGLLDGFRVRVEWSELYDEAGRPLDGPPSEATLSYVLPVGRSTPAGRVGLSVRTRGITTRRPDDVIEVLADRPVGELSPKKWSLSTREGRIPFTLRTNRNPPDWIYLHPHRPLASGPATLVVPGDGVRGTDGRPMEAPFEYAFEVAGESVEAHPSTVWSEPPEGFARMHTDSPSFALRFADRPTLLGVEESAPDLRIEDAGGRVVARRPRLAHDPTPGHYRSLVVDFDATLEPDSDYALAWSALQPDTFAPATPGRWRFRTSSRPRPIAPLGNAASCFATPSGAHVQFHVPVAASHGLVSVRAAVDGTPVPIVPRAGEAFHPAASGPARSVWESPPDAPPLPARPEPSERRIELVLEDEDGDRVLEGLVFDLGTHALRELRADRSEGGVDVHWRCTAPACSLHLALLDEEGRPAWAGLFAPETGRARVDPCWTPEVPLSLQAWLVRARPEDDVWDYFVTEIPVD